MAHCFIYFIILLKGARINSPKRYIYISGKSGKVVRNTEYNLSVTDNYGTLDALRVYHFSGDKPDRDTKS